MTDEHLRSQAAGVTVDPSQVDLVALNAEGTSVELFLVNDAGWTGSDAQLESLQMKVQAYVSYAVDGVMVAAYPDTQGLPWRVVVHTQAGAPDPRAAEVLEALAQRLPAHGGTVESGLQRALSGTSTSFSVGGARTRGGTFGMTQTSAGPFTEIGYGSPRIAVNQTTTEQVLWDDSPFGGW